MANETEFERWSFSKWISGLWNGKTWGKAAIFGILICLQWFILSSVIDRFMPKKQPTHAVTESINANSGEINKTDSHDAVDKKSYSILSLFDGWFK